jgi:hypothetical protein
MAFDKTWEGADGTVVTDLLDYENWQPMSLVNATFKWTQSPATATEYYLELAGGGDPGIPEPPAVLEAGAEMAAGTVGSLAAGEWDFGDNDSLGYSTIYVRLDAAADPDSQIEAFVQLRDIPRTGDSVRVPPGSGAITTNTDISSTTLVDWIVEEGFSNAIGSPENYCRIKITGQFRVHSQAVAYFDLSDSSVSPIIQNTGPAGFGTVGLELIGSALATVTQEAGSLGISNRHGKSATVATFRQRGGSAILGADLVLTTGVKESGTLTQRCNATTVTNYKGRWRTEEAAANTTVNVEGGEFIHESTGTDGTVNANAGLYDLVRGAATTVEQAKGATVIERAAAAIGTHNLPAAPMQVTVSAV